MAMVTEQETVMAMQIEATGIDIGNNYGSGPEFLLHVPLVEYQSKDKLI